MSDTESTPATKDDFWADTTWEGHERKQLQEWAKIPFAEKVKGLEEMQKLATMFQAARRKMGLKTIFPDGRIEE
jgi:hypothetical protein